MEIKKQNKTVGAGDREREKREQRRTNPERDRQTDTDMKWNNLRKSMNEQNGSSEVNKEQDSLKR